MGQGAGSPGKGILNSKGTTAVIFKDKWLLEVLQELLTLAGEGSRSFETESFVILLRKRQ